MKFWQKIYLVTIVISLLFVNAGIYLVFHITYNKNIETAQKQADSDYRLIGNAIEKDMLALEDQKRLNETTIDSLFESYEQFYKKQDLSLQLWKNDKVIFSNIQGFKDKDKTYTNEEKVTIQTVDHNKYIYVSDKMDGLEENYFLVYIRPLTELNEIWNQLNIIFVAISIGISLCLAIVLFVLLKHLTEPVKKLSIAANHIAMGNYKERVEVNGADEISDLSRNFNNMADDIEQKIIEITRETENKQIFIDNLAHEIKTPLTTIYGFAEYMQIAKMTEEDKRVSLEYIMEESKRLKNMAYSLLDLAMLRNEKIEFESLNTEDLLNRVLKTVEIKLDEKQIKIERQVSVENIYGNKNLLESLFINLLVNAACACELEGQISVLITRDTSDNNVSIEICDNGIGMESEEIMRITEPFYRVDKARSRENGGAGLGLALCKQIVLAHQGEIIYTSKPGEGTKVVIVLWKSQ